MSASATADDTADENAESVEKKKDADAEDQRGKPRD
jgi:hypothetical protein